MQQDSPSNTLLMHAHRTSAMNASYSSKFVTLIYGGICGVDLHLIYCDYKSTPNHMHMTHRRTNYLSKIQVYIWSFITDANALYAG